MKISAPTRFLFAASAFFATSTNIRRTHASVWNAPDTRSDEVATEKVDKDVAVPFESVTTKSNDEATLMSTSGHKDAYHAVSFEEAMQPTARKGASQSGDKADTGDLDGRVNPTQQKVPQDTARQTFEPSFYDPDTDSLEAFDERVLQEEDPEDSPYSCIVDETSCTGTRACEDSPYLQVEPFACTTPSACSQSERIMVGTKSCIGGSGYWSCLESPGACIGQESCTSDALDVGACWDSSRIHVSDHSCKGPGACNRSPDATIEVESCIGPDACLGSPNITVERFSCVGRSACHSSEGAKIGQYACRCNRCCRNLNSTCVIPDFQCNNDGGPEGACDFLGQAKDGCPQF